MPRKKSALEIEFEQKSGLKLGAVITNGNGKVYNLKGYPNRVVKIASIYDQESLNYFLNLLGKLKKMKSKIIVRIHQFGHISGYNYYYVMDKLRVMGGNRWDKGDMIQEYLYGERLRSNELSQVKTFVKKARVLERRYHYGDVHGGNIMQNGRGALKFVDLESFTY